MKQLKFEFKNLLELKHLQYCNNHRMECNNSTDFIASIKKLVRYKFSIFAQRLNDHSRSKWSWI